MIKIETEAQLAELQNDPAKMSDYVRGMFDEYLQEQGIKGQQRIPHSEEAAAKTPDFADADGTAKSVWLGDNLKGPMRAEAMSMNGLFKGLDPRYKGFSDFLASISPENIKRNGIDPRLKVLGESQGDAGGFLVPDEQAMTLMALALEDSIVRPRAFIMPMTQPTLRMPVIRDASHATTVFGGVRAYFTPESGAVTASEPTFAQMVLTAKKLTLYTTASNELVLDSAIAIEALLMRLFPQAYAFFEDDSFINGNGAGDPLGILNSDALVTVAKESGQAATTIVLENIDKMWSRMLPTSQNRAVWVMNPDCWPQIAALSRNVGTGGSAVMMVNASQGPAGTIYGRPIITSEKALTLGQAGDLYLADFSMYVVGDRQAVSMVASPHVRFLNDETVWRFTGRFDGRPWLDTPLTPRNGTNTLSPFVNLATRA